MKKDKIFHFDNVDDLIKLLKSKIKSNDVILIKGSRGIKLEKAIENL